MFRKTIYRAPILIVWEAWEARVITIIRRPQGSVDYRLDGYRLRQEPLRNPMTIKDVHIRPLDAEEVNLLEEFLYQAIFIPEEVEAPPRSIIESPDLQVYIEDFGRNETDNALVAEVDDRVIGAVWTRIMDDYGHIDDETPSFAISLLPEYRSQGIGTKLMNDMLQLLEDQGFARASLSVQKQNYAVNLYLKLGFEVIDETNEEYLMLIKLH